MRGEEGGWNVCVLCGYCKSLLLVLWHCIKLMHAKFNRRKNRTEREQEREGEREGDRERGNRAECRVQSSVAGSAVRRTYMLALVINIL